MTRPHPPLVERFWDKVSPEPMSGCWLWIGATNEDGYGRIIPGGADSKKPRLAHRVSFHLFRGPIPNGREINHKCRVRCCVNPDHLEAVTRTQHLKIDADIFERGLKKGRATVRRNQQRRTHCKYGHALTKDNLTNEKNRRRCLTCARRHWRTYGKKRRLRNGT